MARLPLPDVTTGGLKDVQKVLTDPTELPLDGLGAYAHLTRPLAVRQPDIMMEVPGVRTLVAASMRCQTMDRLFPTGDQDRAAQSLS